MKIEQLSVHNGLCQRILGWDSVSWGVVPVPHPFFRGRPSRVVQRVLGPFPAPTQPIEVPTDDPWADRALRLDQFGPEQRHRPAGGVLAPGLGIGLQQRGQPLLSSSVEAARLLETGPLLQPGQP